MSVILLGSIIILLVSIILLIFITFKGKTILDRVLGLDLLAIACIAIFLIVYFKTQVRFYMDIALLLALVGFVTALVFAVFIPSKRDR
jgi:multisubunit Na+/H+ antiporter MnhF subunit